MGLRPLPAAAADLTAAWLNAALTQSPEWNGGPIVSLALEPIGGGDSLASAVLLASVGVKTQEGPVEPVQLLVKLHHPDVSRRSDGYYAAETYFYRELAPRADTPVPKTYVADFDEGERRMVIVQEFLADGRIGTADSSLSIEDLERVLTCLSRMHATWWNSQELAGMAGVRTFESAIGSAIVRLRNSDLSVRRFLDRFGELVDRAVGGYYEAMPSWMERVKDGLSHNFSLVHLDCSGKNLFIPHDRRRDPVLFDWALFRSGNVGIDLATLLCYSMDPAEHHLMPDLVRSYHTELVERGVNNYGYDELWDDFRFGCLWRLAAPIANASVGTVDRDNHARTIIPLLDSAVLSCRALELLGEP